MFSILEPGKRLPPHRGPYNGVLRLHLGLLIPEPRERAAIRVGPEQHHWTEGRVLIFDDAYEHEAWNETEQVRVVLFVDFERPHALSGQCHQPSAARSGPLHAVSSGRRQTTCGAGSGASMAIRPRRIGTRRSSRSTWPDSAATRRPVIDEVCAGGVLKAEIDAPSARVSGWWTAAASTCTGHTRRRFAGVLQEIGRLRELTFRAVGEGTGKASDIDPFDAYYLHMFVWDAQADAIVGAYRLGLVERDPLAVWQAGPVHPFPVQVRPRMLDMLKPAIELGRSFVRAEYQRSFAPMLLLWRGIARFIECVSAVCGLVRAGQHQQQLLAGVPPAHGRISVRSHAPRPAHGEPRQAAAAVPLSAQTISAGLEMPVLPGASKNCRGRLRKSSPTIKVFRCCSGNTCDSAAGSSRSMWTANSATRSTASWWLTCARSSRRVLARYMGRSGDDRVPRVSRA